MTAPAYEVKELDLATARTRQYIIPSGKQIDGVTVLGLPAGATAEIAFGSSRDYIELFTQGQSFELCPPTTEGLLITNPVGAGTLTLLISYGGLTTGA